MEYGLSKLILEIVCRKVLRFVLGLAILCRVARLALFDPVRCPLEHNSKGMFLHDNPASSISCSRYAYLMRFLVYSGTISNYLKTKSTLYYNCISIHYWYF
jgi:hypothetical protein